MKHLQRCGAPTKLIEDFLEVVEIDEGIEGTSGDLETLDRLVMDVCARFNFARPFDLPSKKAYFRPKRVGVADCAQTGDEFDPLVEQAYRRGYVQGFSNARRLVEAGESELRTTEAQLQRWRTTPITFGATWPPVVEPFGIKVSIRTSLPAKIRYQVLQRDRRRCVVCGACAADGATLHVDHIVSLYNGGTDDSENLQTLCEPCNLGKGKD